MTPPPAADLDNFRAIADAIATLESDKATMDVPSTVEGTVKEVLIQLGSRVSEGAVLIKVEAGAAAAHRREQTRFFAPALGRSGVHVHRARRRHGLGRAQCGLQLGTHSQGVAVARKRHGRTEHVAGCRV